MTTPENPPPGGDDPGRALSGVQRAGIVLAAFGVLLIVFVVLRGGDDSGSPSSSSAPQTATTQSTTTPAGDSASTAASTGDSGSNSGSGSSSGSNSKSGSSSSSSSASSSSASTTTRTRPAAPPVRTITVVNGQPQGGVKTLSYKKGDEIRLKVQSDVADEIHVHGYDLKKNVTAGGSVTFDFKATIEGRFEIELEHAGTQIATLEVTPT